MSGFDMTGSEHCSTVRPQDLYVRHLEPQFEMLEGIIRNCPSSLWEGGNATVAIWKQAYHVLYWTGVWLRSYDSPFEWPTFHQNEYLDMTMKGTAISKKQMVGLLESVRCRSVAFVKSISEQRLFTEVDIEGRRWTPSDIILSQMRHLQHHIGYMNCLLRVAGSRPVRWLGYREEGMDFEWYHRSILRWTRTEK